jgi:3-oxoacyl-[acyl-carrier protein] reductase
MDLQIKDKLFVVTGGSSGFGKAISATLHSEGANVISVARGQEKLGMLKDEHPGIETVSMDITQPESINLLLRQIGQRELSGIVVNAGGPPAKSFLETDIGDWDTAYRNILRWKVEITKAVLPIFQKYNYGRFLYIESISTKQPVPNLVLSTSLRLAVTGFVKTLSSEIGKTGITANILGPGFHLTPALERVIKKESEVRKVSFDEAKMQMLNNVPTGRIGETTDFASLASWLLSPWSSYITGQTITVDGGAVQGIMG